MCSLTDRRLSKIEHLYSQFDGRNRMVRRAQCQCGGFTATAATEPGLVMACHCTWCQRRSGNVRMGHAPRGNAALSSRATQLEAASVGSLVSRLADPGPSPVASGHGSEPLSTGTGTRRRTYCRRGQARRGRAQGDRRCAKDRCDLERATGGRARALVLPHELALRLRRASRG